MRKSVWIAALLLGMLSREAYSYELGVGAGRMYGCLSQSYDDKAICAVGPAVSVHYGFNLWGKRYSAAEHESHDALGSEADAAATNFDTDGLRFMGNLGGRIDNWESLAAVVVISLFMVSIGYAILYPFSSRAEAGFIGRTGLQSATNHDELWRNELGIYFRGYLSQHVPMYIYGSGLFSHQNITIDYRSDSHNVLIKRLGLGLMSPSSAGLYFQGTWERSTLLDPNAGEVIRDAASNKLGKQSISKILDGSNFELGYLWYL